MKKFVWILAMVLLVMACNTTVVFADAASYDIEQADYYVYVATPDGGLNMRYGPGENYDKVMEERIPDDVQLYIQLKSGNWGYTSYNGNEGWVALRQTKTTPPAQPAPTPAPAPAPVPQPAEETPKLAEEPEVVEEKQVTEPEKEEPAEEEETLMLAEENPAETEATEKALESAMTSQIILIAVLVLLVIVVALLVLIMINMKGKGKNQ